MGYPVARDNDMIVTNNESWYMCLTMILMYFTFNSSIVAASSRFIHQSGSNSLCMRSEEAVRDARFLP